jgi:predicted nuclease of predicted toxin-antitoxin system
MATIDWKNGQLITLKEGDTASCTGNLNKGQLYGLFFYNSAGNDSDTNITVVGTSSLPPVSVRVPGTTANEGLASICFVSGDDTNSISASVLQGQPGAYVQAFIGSVKMPLDTSSISNQSLPMDGQMHSFTKFTRYYAVPASHFYAATIKSNVNTFISVQFMENSAVVNAVNASSIDNVIQYYANSKSLVTSNVDSHQSIQWYVKGNGSQIVWINADSIQNSQTAAISLQSLQSIYALMK